MGAALRVSRNNPAPNTKMVALRTAAGTLCIQLRDVIGEIAPPRRERVAAAREPLSMRLRYSAARKKTEGRVLINRFGRGRWQCPLFHCRLKWSMQHKH